MNRSNWFFTKGMSRRRLQLLLMGGVLVVLGSATTLYSDFKLLTGGLLVPPWDSFVVAALMIVFGLLNIVMAWRQLWQDK